MSIANEAEISPEEMLRLPKEEQGELVDGVMLEKPVNIRSSWVGSRLAYQINDFVVKHDLGWGFGPDMGIRAFPRKPNQVRRPDYSFVKKQRLSLDEFDQGYLTVVPDFIVEVTSPRDIYEDVEERVIEFLEAGTPLIWLINPGLRIAKVYRDGDERPEVYHEVDLISGDPVLPDFQLKLKDIFPPTA